eukprot:11208334-Lingulodinium_polyedra.AAC.1
MSSITPLSGQVWDPTPRGATIHAKIYVTRRLFQRKAWHAAFNLHAALRALLLLTLPGQDVDDPDFGALAVQ